MRIRNGLLRHLCHARSKITSHVNCKGELVGAISKWSGVRTVNGASQASLIRSLVSDPASQLCTQSKSVGSHVETEDRLQIVNHHWPRYGVPIRQQPLNVVT